MRTAHPRRQEGDGLAGLVLEAAPDAMLVCTPAGAIRHANEEAVRLFGHGRRELSRLDLKRLLAPDGPGPEALRQMIPSGAGGPLRLTLEARSQDGRLLPLEVAMRPVPTQDGMRLIVSVRDLTRTRRMEQELLRRTEELEGVNGELEAFADCVGHDLRSPLSTLAMFTDLLTRTCRDQVDDEGRQLLRHISESAHHIGDILEGLQHLSQVTSAPLVRARVDLVPIARRIAERLEQERPGGPRLESPAKLRVHADPGLMTVLLENLLGNAWKYARREGAVVELAQAGDGLCRVRDNGPGFDPQLSEEVFRPFRRLQERQDEAGQGIGLATVRRIVRRHGGVVWVESRPGEGATFYFTLHGGTRGKRSAALRRAASYMPGELGAAPADGRRPAGPEGGTRAPVGPRRKGVPERPPGPRIDLRRRNEDR